MIGDFQSSVDTSNQEYPSVSFVPPINIIIASWISLYLSIYCPVSGVCLVTKCSVNIYFSNDSTMLSTASSHKDASESEPSIRDCRSLKDYCGHVRTEINLLPW